MTKSPTNEFPIPKAMVRILSGEFTTGVEPATEFRALALFSRDSWDRDFQGEIDNALSTTGVTGEDPFDLCVKFSHRPRPSSVSDAAVSLESSLGANFIDAASELLYAWIESGELQIPDNAAELYFSAWPMDVWPFYRSCARKQLQSFVPRLGERLCWGDDSQITKVAKVLDCAERVDAILDAASADAEIDGDKYDTAWCKALSDALRVLLDAAKHDPDGDGKLEEEGTVDFFLMEFHWWLTEFYILSEHCTDPTHMEIYRECVEKNMCDGDSNVDLFTVLHEQYLAGVRIWINEVLSWHGHCENANDFHAWRDLAHRIVTDTRTAYRHYDRDSLLGFGDRLLVHIALGYDDSPEVQDDELRRHVIEQAWNAESAPIDIEFEHRRIGSELVAITLREARRFGCVPFDEPPPIENLDHALELVDRITVEALRAAHNGAVVPAQVTDDAGSRSIAQEALDDPTGNEADKANEAEEAVHRYVTLEEISAIMNRSKRTVEKWKTRKRNPLPAPDVDGGGGKPDEWLWERIRPWLEDDSGKNLPENFPDFRIRQG